MYQCRMGKHKPSPFSEHRNDQIKQIDKLFDTFFIFKRTMKKNVSFHTVSPFLVEKVVTANLGITKSTRILCSGDLLIEVASPENYSTEISGHYPCDC
ncbi:hypothetical protein AVEN_91418-1 [Araneus ventricosus]|uniref:Uncharacterized protein n=1 Tax=Araneus ventricosus TaxID=182803 RepID=A0A4Y2II31_ARAVE|nr:hypothetical protein AVEN_91418-1 [Araneus ventricosus]